MFCPLHQITLTFINTHSHARYIRYTESCPLNLLRLGMSVTFVATIRVRCRRHTYSDSMTSVAPDHVRFIRYNKSRPLRRLHIVMSVTSATLNHVRYARCIRYIRTPDMSHISVNHAARHVRFTRSCPLHSLHQTMPVTSGTASHGRESCPLPTLQPLYLITSVTTVNTKPRPFHPLHLIASVTFVTLKPRPFIRNTENVRYIRYTEPVRCIRYI